MTKQKFQTNRDRVAMALAKSGHRQAVVIEIGDHIDREDEKHARQRIEFAAEYGSKLVMQIDSCGGLCRPADAIARDVLALRIPVEARVDGCCMSAAVRLFAAARVRLASRAARFMIHRSGYNSDFNPSRYTALELRDLAEQREGWDEGLLEFLQDRGVRLSNRWEERFNNGENIYFGTTSAQIIGLVTRVELTPEEQKQRLKTQWNARRNAIAASVGRELVREFRAQLSIGHVPSSQPLIARHRMVIF